MKEQLPNHVAIIMDGNGRWAKAKNRPRIFGHREGANRVREIIEESARLGIPYLTLYAFSEENWSRPQKEVSFLMELLNLYLVKERDLLQRNGIQLKTIGDLRKLPKRTQELVSESVQSLAQNQGMTLTLALSYSGRSEILNMVRSVVEDVEKGAISAQEINEEYLCRHMCSGSLPDVDLLIRTSGEQRISNFMLWHLSYAEMYFSQVFWPEFTAQEFHTALRSFASRERRFGKLISADNASEDFNEEEYAAQSTESVTC